LLWVILNVDWVVQVEGEEGGLLAGHYVDELHVLLVLEKSPQVEAVSSLTGLMTVGHSPLNNRFSHSILHSGL